MTVQQTLKKYFGYDSFRKGQSEIVGEILQGRDTVGIMPTGAGKSICFQLPALLVEGIALIVSPLISLMKDQVGTLIQAGIPAAYINSSLTPKQAELALYNAANGKYKLIYVAPERILSPDFLMFAQSVNISLLTVDEAHCISQWGQDFRPSYAQIPEFINSLNKRPVVSAFTATATPRVREDIVSILRLENPYVLVSSYDRENLYFEVCEPKNKLNALHTFLKQTEDKSGIVYCSTRKAVDEVCESLNQSGYNALRYHAGLSDKERCENQDDFIFDRAKIMVATNAFGMGIDKSNVRFVVHYNMPKDIESYYQEAGRAGRDGAPATCLLLYSGQDVRTNQWLIENGRDKEYEDYETEQTLKEQEYNRLREMTFYSTTHSCLRGFILKYFGENPSSFCGHCSNCDTKYETLDVTQESCKLLTCIQNINGRFGITMIIDILRGSKNERLLSFGFDKMSVFGTSDKSVTTLRRIIDELLAENYLEKSNGQYPVISVTDKASKILNGSETITMKLPTEKLRERKQGKESTDISAKEFTLYENLKALRAKLAKAQSVPAFVVFTDSAIIDMCKKLPQSDKEFLAVSGVGEQKLKRYGQEFIEAILEYCSENDIIAKPKAKRKKQSTKEKTNDFSYITNEAINNISVSDEKISVNVIAANINAALALDGSAVVSGKKIADWLVGQGYLRLMTKDTKSYKEPTVKGEEFGISIEMRVGKNEEFQMNLYSKEMQQFVIGNILEIIK